MKVGLVGFAGSGKTTIFNTLTGLTAEVGGYGAFHHNLFYNTLSRSPEVDCDLIDWSYNIMANLRSGHSLRPQSRFKFTYNYIIDMPDNLEDYSFNANDAVWAEGNIRRKGDATGEYRLKHAGSEAGHYLKTPYPTMPLTHNDANSLIDVLIPTVGASLPVRDRTDSYFIDMLLHDKSKLPVFKEGMDKWHPYGNQNDRMDQYIPWEQSDCPPPKAGAKPIVDTDGDGMPDAWETAHGLNPNDASDGAVDSDKDGYTNLEEFLNNTDPHVFVDYTKPENNKDNVFTAEAVAKANPSTQPAVAK